MIGKEGSLSLSLLLHCAFYISPGVSASLPPRASVLKGLQSWPHFTQGAEYPSVAPSFQPADTGPQTTSASPFRTACLSFSARGQLRSVSIHTDSQARRASSRPTLSLHKNTTRDFLWVGLSVAVLLTCQ